MKNNDFNDEPAGEPVVTDFEFTRRDKIRNLKADRTNKIIHFPEAASILDLFPRIQFKYSNSLGKSNYTVLAKTKPWSKERNQDSILSGYLSIRPTNRDHARGLTFNIEETTPALVKWWKQHCIHSPNSTFTFEVTEWQNGFAIVTMQNIQTTSSYWLAIVRNGEIPFYFNEGDAGANDGFEIVRAD